MCSIRSHLKKARDLHDCISQLSKTIRIGVSTSVLQRSTFNPLIKKVCLCLSNQFENLKANESLDDSGLLSKRYYLNDTLTICRNNNIRRAFPAYGAHKVVGVVFLFFSFLSKAKESSNFKTKRFLAFTWPWVKTFPLSNAKFRAGLDNPL